MESVKQFIGRKLQLQVNEAKSAVGKPQERKFLGFSFVIKRGKEPKRQIAPKAMDRFKERVREITGKAKGVSMEQMIEELARYLRGWRGYFGFCETPWVLHNLDSWVRRRVRRAFWWQWKTSRQRLAELMRRGVCGWLAAAAVRGGPVEPRHGTKRCPTRFSILSVYLRSLEVTSTTDRTAVYANRTYGGVGGVEE